MTRRPSLFPHEAAGLPASLGGLLWALLCALLGIGARRVRYRPESLEGTLAPVLVAEAGAVLEFEPYVEWEAVPAPWRNGQLLPVRHARALSVALPCRRLQPFTRGRGPPWAEFIALGWQTGMA